MPKRKTSNKRGRRGGNTPSASAPASAPFAVRPVAHRASAPFAARPVAHRASAPASAPFAARPVSTAKTFKGTMATHAKTASKTVKDTATNALNLVKGLFGGGKSRRHKRRSRKRHTRKRKRAKSHKKRKHKHVRH